MYYPKYRESDGIKVYTRVSTWSSERADEYKLRRWEEINATAEKIE